ncbi:MAG: hypothetical protein PUJ57_01915 [Peptoniphilaceae bacterium]|nr:hypothetical protein [Peptoniphilaceae bacterium]
MSRDWNFSEETLKAIVARIYQRLEENKAELDVTTDYGLGVVDGMEQVIDMIKNDLEGRNLRASDYGIKL